MEWHFTDEIKPADYISNWKPGATIRFDGTIDKSGERHTDIGVKIEENDVSVLLNKLISNYKSKIKILIRRVNELEKNEERLKEAFRKIDYLTSLHKDRAPTEAELIEAVQEIAEYYSSWGDGNKPPQPKWLKWQSL